MQNWKSEVDYHVVLSRQYISEKNCIGWSSQNGKALSLHILKFEGKYDENSTLSPRLTSALSKIETMKRS